MRKLTLLVSAAAIATAMSTGAIAYSDNANENAAQGQAKAKANCGGLGGGGDGVVAKQDANGQTGANTGSANDPKQNPTAVTNCDHYWQSIGVIGPD